MNLKISNDLELPIEAVTQTFGILAKRGAGKTYTGCVMVEEMLISNQQVIIADPIGVWWGLRSSADGKSPGFPIVVFGGEHGDIPLEENAGEIVAQAIIENGFSAVIDLSLFRKAAQNRFMLAFAETLYRLNRKPLHLVVDEADEFAPQRPLHGNERLLGAFEDIVRRGRARGLGVTLITQRAAVLNKNVLTQIEVLVVLRTISPQDREAIEAWTEVHGTPQQLEQLSETMASLPIGTAWFWSPGWLDVFQKIKVRKKITFDSSATPKVGEVVVKPRALAEVNLEKLGAQIKATADNAKANDPAELKREIARLKKEAAVAPAKVETKEVPALTDAERKRLTKLIETFEGFIRDLNAVNAILAITSGVKEQVNNEVKFLHDLLAGKLLAQPQRVINKPMKYLTGPGITKLVPVQNGNPELSAGGRKVLIAAAQYPDGVSRETLKVLTGYRATSLYEYSRMITAQGYVEQRGDLLVPTEAGIAALGNDYEQLPTGDALVQHWRGRLSGGELKIFELVIANTYPVSREQIMDATGFKATSTYEYTRMLKARRIVVDSGTGLIAAKEFFK